jgi:hypothetical protein
MIALSYHDHRRTYPCEHPPREVTDLYWSGWSYTTDGGPF